MNEYTVYIFAGVFFAIFLGVILPFAIKDIKKILKLKKKMKSISTTISKMTVR